MTKPIIKPTSLGPSELFYGAFFYRLSEQMVKQQIKMILLSVHSTFSLYELEGNKHPSLRVLLKYRAIDPLLKRGKRKNSLTWGSFVLRGPELGFVFYQLAHCCANKFGVSPTQVQGIAEALGYTNQPTELASLIKEEYPNEEEGMSMEDIDEGIEEQNEEVLVDQKECENTRFYMVLIGGHSLESPKVYGAITGQDSFIAVLTPAHLCKLLYEFLKKNKGIPLNPSFQVAFSIRLQPNKKLELIYDRKVIVRLSRGITALVNAL